MNGVPLIGFAGDLGHSMSRHQLWRFVASLPSGPRVSRFAMHQNGKPACRSHGAHATEPSWHLRGRIREVTTGVRYRFFQQH